MLALLAPSQGSQTPGFLRPWLDLPGALPRLRWFSEVSRQDLVMLGTEADETAIKDTAVTQPLIVAAGLLAAEQLPELTVDAAVVAGHSVGELTAAALAGALSPESAVALAGVRGREMAAACGRVETGMAAVLGGDAAEVTARIEDCGLVAANRNGAGQVVAAGPLEGLAKLADNPPARAKVRQLKVAGAFHTPYMASAEEAIGAFAAGVPVANPHPILLSNYDGTAVVTGREAIKRLVRQITSPVRWDLCQGTLRDLGVTAVVELPPAGTLAGLAKRELKGVEIVAVKTPDDLAAARDLLARHAQPHAGEPTVTFRVLVAPAAGTFARADVDEGDTLAAGATVGQVVTRRDATAVTATDPSVLVEWLAHDGDPVASGQPLVRLHPTGGNL